jgi:hypothetical protein
VVTVNVASAPRWRTGRTAKRSTPAPSTAPNRIAMTVAMATGMPNLPISV